MAKRSFFLPRFFAFRTAVRDEISGDRVEVNTPRVRHVRAPLEKGDPAGQEQKQAYSLGLRAAECVLLPEGVG